MTFIIVIPILRTSVQAMEESHTDMRRYSKAVKEYSLGEIRRKQIICL